MVLDTYIIWNYSSLLKILICVAASQFASACLICDSFLYIMTYNIKIRQKLSNKFGHLSKKCSTFWETANSMWLMRQMKVDRML